MRRNRKEILFMNLSTKRINLKTIDLKDDTFLLSYGYNLNLLKQSIKKVGVINPPILRKKPDATYQTICGHKRIHSLRELGVLSLTCAIVPSETSDRECLLLSLYDNSSHRELNPIEKSMAIRKLQNYYPEERIVHDFLPLLKLQPHGTQLNTFKPLCTLEREIKKAILEGKINEHTAIALSQMDRTSRRELGKLLITLKLSVSNQAEILEYVSEIAIRETLPIEEVISTPEIKSILDNGKLNQPQKSEAIRKYLRERRYPQLIEKEREFAYNLKKLKLHPNIKLKHPPFFEGSHYHLSLCFKDLEGLRERVRELESHLNNPSLLNTIEG